MRAIIAQKFSSEKCLFSFQTELCGWGVDAAEPINKGDFVIEYIGEGSFTCSGFKFSVVLFFTLFLFKYYCQVMIVKEK